jgi:hypothetical protein
MAKDADMLAKYMVELMRLGLVEEGQKDGERVLYLTEKGRSEYARSLVATCALAAEERMSNPYYAGSPAGVVTLKEGVKRARNVAARFQAAVQSGNLLEQVPEHDFVLLNKAVEATVQRTEGRQLNEEEKKYFTANYLNILMDELNPDSLDYWFTGSKPSTIGG